MGGRSTLNPEGGEGGAFIQLVTGKAFELKYCDALGDDGRGWKFRPRCSPDSRVSSDTKLSALSNFHEGRESLLKATRASGEFQCDLMVSPKLKVSQLNDWCFPVEGNKTEPCSHFGCLAWRGQGSTLADAIILFDNDCNVLSNRRKSKWPPKNAKTWFGNSCWAAWLLPR